MKHYAEREIMDQKYYADHISAMTREELNSKSDIAAELAHRDEKNDKLTNMVKSLFGALSDMHAQHKCGCGHPSCNRCKDDSDNEALLSSIWV